MGYLIACSACRPAQQSNSGIEAGTAEGILLKIRNIPASFPKGRFERQAEWSKDGKLGCQSNREIENHFSSLILLKTNSIQVSKIKSPSARVVARGS
jgi:hypothetical protein